MTGIWAGSAGAASSQRGALSGTRGPARWLGLAATPTFALMAVLTGVFGGGMDMVCSGGQGSLLDGMVPMYVLMSAFHAPAWLKLIASRPILRDAREGRAPQD